MELRNNNDDRVGTRRASDSSLIRLRDDDSKPKNLFAEQVAKSRSTSRRARRIGVLAIVLVALYVFSLIVPTSLGSLFFFGPEFDHTHVIILIQENMRHLMAALTFQDYNARAAKMLVVALAGAGLGLTGAIYQGSLRNGLASPSTLGIMSGAQLGALVYVILFVNDPDHVLTWKEEAEIIAAQQTQWGGGSVATFYGQAAFSLMGCALVAAVLLLMMRLAGKHGVNGIFLIVLGQIVGSTAGGVVAIARYYYLITDEFGVKSYAIQNLMAASFFRGFTTIDIIMILVPLAIVFAYIMANRSKLAMLALPEEEARAMGVDTRRMRNAMVASCTVLTAIIVSLCGMVGFVGFLVPHLTRRIVGPDFRYQIPASALMGAVFVLGCFTAICMVHEDYSTAVGLLISIVGGVVFLVTALRRKDGVGDGRF